MLWEYSYTSKYPLIESKKNNSNFYLDKLEELKKIYFDFPGVPREDLKVEFNESVGTLIIKQKLEKEWIKRKTLKNVYKEPTSIVYKDGRMTIEFDNSSCKDSVELKIK